MKTTDYPRRVKTGPLRKARGAGMRGDGYNYRMLSGLALFKFEAAVSRASEAFARIAGAS